MNNNGIFTISLFVMAFGEVFMSVNISIQSDNVDNFNFITEINVTNPKSEVITSIKYTDRPESMIEITILFLNIIELFYDTEKLFILGPECQMSEIKSCHVLGYTNSSLAAYNRRIVDV